MMGKPPDARGLPRRHGEDGVEPLRSTHRRHRPAAHAAREEKGCRPGAEACRDHVRRRVLQPAAAGPPDRAPRRLRRPAVTPLLREVDYGRYEGLTTQQIHDSDPEWEVYKDGCPGGETPAQIYTRARSLSSWRQAKATRGSSPSRTATSSARSPWRGIRADITVATGLQLDGRRSTSSATPTGPRRRAVEWAS